MGFGGFKYIGKLAQKPVNQLLKQVDILEGDVLNPVGNFADRILDGVWTGEDAEAFANEVQQELAPKVEQLMAAIMGVNPGFSKISDAADTADNNIQNIAGQLQDMFGGIF